MGDSITYQGYYISPLMTKLTNNGYTPTLIANEGHSGYIIDGTITGATRAGLREYIGVGKSPDFLNHPNVNATNTFILLMIGTNDVNTYCQLGSSAVQSRMSGLISAIRTEAPLSHLIVAEIVPNLGAGMDPLVQQFNHDIAAVAIGTNVSLVDMYTPFQPNPSPYMGDALHPNQAGGNLMADVWYQGIRTAPEPSVVGLLAAAAVALVGWRVWRVRKSSSAIGSAHP